jgi:exopolysaccharide biosynthesis polyprenyl glycosylphosphotransferase
MSEIKNPQPSSSTAADRRRLRLVEESHTAADFPQATQVSRGSAVAKQYRNKLVVTDISIILISVVAAFVGRFVITDGGLPVGGITPASLMVSGLIIVTWIVVLGAYRTRDARVVGVGATEYKRVVAASALTFGLLAIFFVIAKIDIARGFFVIALPLGLASLIVARWTWRHWLTRQRRYGRYLSQAIVVGRRNDVDYVVRQIARKSGAAYNVVGVALEDTVAQLVKIGGRELPVVSDIDNVAKAVSALGADVVIVAGQPSGRSEFIRDLGWELEGTAAELVVASRLTNVAGPRIHIRPVEGLPLMHVELPQYEGGRHAMKRALDFVVSGFALLFLMPLMLVIAMFVRLDSNGPIIFRQERVGRGGQPFTMLKFRSMVQTAEDDLAGLLDQNEGAGLLFKMKNDPRITNVGKILRKYSLDELPQLINVFLGHMSLVGPRPPLQSEVSGYEENVHRRLFIKPGLTGMWQVNGRSNLSWEESVRLDLYYVENWSMTGDLIIMWRTIKVLVNPEGAY